MPRPEWSFFMPAEDHKRLKWLQSFLQAKLTRWGQIIFSMIFIGLSLSSVGTQISAYFFVSFIWALMITSFLLSFFFKPTIRASLCAASKPTAGGYCLYRVNITNTGRRPLRNLTLLAHKLPYGLYAQPDTLEQKDFVAWLEPGQQTTLTIQLRIPRRGFFIIEPLLIGTSFPSGLLRSLKRITQRTPFYVLPKLLKIKDPLLLINQQSQQLGSGNSVSFGGSNEFLSTREYRDGDRIKDIHWNSSAKSGKLIIKEYSKESSQHVGFFIDTELKRYEKHRSFEAQIALCAGIAEDFFKHHYCLDLFTCTAKHHKKTIKTFQHDFSRFLETLAEIEGEEQIHFNDVLVDLKMQGRKLSSLIILLKDWNQDRIAFINSIKDLNIPFKIIIIHTNPKQLKKIDPTVFIYTPQQLGYTP